MASARTQLLCLTLSTAVCAVVGWRVAVRLDRAPELLDRGEEVRRLLEEHETGAREPLSGADSPPEPISLDIPEEVAETLFGLSRRQGGYDPVRYLRYPPHLDSPRPWAEHPDREFRKRTNSLGMIEIAEPAARRPELRVLATGDSHTDGVCAHDESWPNALEALLQEAHPGRTIEVLNAGKGGYSFYNYLGVLRDFLDLEPHAFVVGVYGGNDFYEALPVHRYLHALPPPPEIHPSPRWRAAAAASEAACQAFIGYKHFQIVPRDVDLALEAGWYAIERIRRLCAEHGIELIIVYIPALAEVQWEEAAGELERVCRILELSDEDLRVAWEMSDRFLERLRHEGLAVVDLRGPMRACSGPLYWRGDHHINLAGQELVARALQPQLEALIER